MSRLGATFVTVAVSLLWLQCGSSDEPKSRTEPVSDREEKTGSMKQIFATYFADYGRTCCVPVPLDLQGSVEWSAELNPTADSAPRAILLMAGIVLVESARTVSAFTDSGRAVWQVNKTDNGAVGVFGGTLYYQDEKFRLSGASLRGEKVLDATYLPDAMDDRFPIRLFAPRQNDFLTVIQFTGGPQEHPTWVKTELTTYGKRTSEWVVKNDGVLQKLALFAEDANLVILPMNELIWVDATTGKEKQRAAYPLNEVGCCCAGSDGTLYVAGGHEGKESLVALDAGGRELWRWQDAEDGGKIECRQPPVLDADGRVYLTTAKSLVAIQKGELVWRHEVEDGPILCATGFRGGVLFATAGMLYRADSEGNATAVLKLSEVLQAPPTVTLDGDVYLLSARQLMKIR